MSTGSERHARGKDDWGAQPPRSAQVSAAVTAETADPSKRAPGKKDKSRCKANAGAPHEPVIVLVRYAASLSLRCEWGTPWLPRDGDGLRWLCRHHEECARCGKDLRPSVEPAECPGYREPTDEERRVLGAEIERMRARMAEREARRPVIAGPQGYRRKRDG